MELLAGRSGDADAGSGGVGPAGEALRNSPAIHPPPRANQSTGGHPLHSTGAQLALPGDLEDRAGGGGWRGLQREGYKNI